MVVAIDSDESDGALQARVEAMTGIRKECISFLYQGRHVSPSELLSQTGISNESTLLLALPGIGGMPPKSKRKRRTSRTAPPRQKRQRVTHNTAGTPAVDAAFEDLCILRRCTARIHRCSPGIEGREILCDANRCGSLGHWSLIVEGKADPVTVSATLLCKACRARRLDVMESLVSHYGVDVNIGDGCGWTALHTAMVHGNEEVVRKLLELGAQEERITSPGRRSSDLRASSLRPKLWARVTGSEVEVEPDDWPMPSSCLSAAHQLVRMIDEGGLKLPILCRRIIAAVDTLGTDVLNELHSGISMDRQESHWSVLMVAFHGGKYHCVRRLCLELGADLGVRNNQGKTALTFACEGVTTKYGDSSSYASTDGVRLLLDFGAKVDTTIHLQKTPLLLFVEKGTEKGIRMLLQYGASVDVSDSDGNTPLHIACVKREVRCALVLLEAGADPSKTNTAGRTPAREVTATAVSGRELLSQHVRGLHDAVKLAETDRTAGIELLRWTVRRLDRRL